MASWDKQAKVLREERKRILDQLGGSPDRVKGIAFRDSVTDLSFADNHPADLGTEEFERSKDMSLKEHHLTQFRMIDEALSRIDEGTYGICRACGQTIDLERLEALPAAPYCYSCQEFSEKAMLDPHRRPVEEERLLPPFAQKIIHGAPGFDMEDSWQEVARHNKRQHIFEDSLEDEEPDLVEDTDAISNEQYREQLMD